MNFWHENGCNLQFTVCEDSKLTRDSSSVVERKPEELGVGGPIPSCPT